jgi:SAM-dependent methyltransferase
MNFDVAADTYDRFMGRYSRLLSAQMADLAGIAPGQRAIDVGCGPGALTAELVARLGPENVAAVDPSEPFVAAARARNPGVEVHHASAEALPFDDDAFDTALAQLVVHFMTDPIAGISQMRRVTRPGGSVVACVWDLAGDRAPLSPFWEGVREIDPTAEDEAELAGVRMGHLAQLFEGAGLREVASVELAVRLEHPTFDEWWEPYTGGVGPAGGYLVAQTPDRQAAIRERCHALLGDGPFTLESVAWAARGLV